ncbi:hypothetical protein Gogos_010585, partial [Gossypium gossypioides]|nr:hypothetical protein [Gossypium gossypioides]
VPWSVDEIIRGSYSLAKQYVSHSKVNSTARQRTSYEFTWLSNWVWLKTDGSIKVDSRMAAVGGVVKDEKGKWIMGFNRQLAKCSILEAELWGILNGLSLSQEK